MGPRVHTCHLVFRLGDALGVVGKKGKWPFSSPFVVSAKWDTSIGVLIGVGIRPYSAFCNISTVPATVPATMPVTSPVTATVTIGVIIGVRRATFQRLLQHRYSQTGQSCYHMTDLFGMVPIKVTF